MLIKQGLLCSEIVTIFSISSYGNHVNCGYDSIMSFDIEKTIQRLQSYNGSPAPILSIYFQLPIPKRVTNETIVNKLQTFINADLPIQLRDRMQNNIEYIAGFMEAYQQRRGERTIAFFSGGNNLFEVLHLPYKVENIVMVSHDPFLLPLLKEMEQDRRYLVILPDREKAIFYTMHSGIVEDKEFINHDTVPQDVKGRWPEAQYAERQNKVQRHVQDHLHQHFKYIAEKAAAFIKSRPVSGVVLGGHRTELSQFEKYLPKPLKEKVVGTFISELKVNFNEIVAKSKDVIEEADKKINIQVNPAAG